MHIKYEEALAQGLLGSDVFRRNHIIYKDELHRNWGVVSLNREAYLIFQDTILLSKHREMKIENREFQSTFESDGLIISIPITSQYMQLINLENAKLGVAFELHLKARLLERGYLLHVIDKDWDNLNTPSQIVHFDRCDCAPRPFELGIASALIVHS